MDERRQHETCAKCVGFVIFILSFLFFLGLIAMAFAIANPQTSTWIIAGVFMGVGFLGLYLLLLNTIRTGFRFENTRFTADAETKRRASDALRNSIHRWRDEAYLAGNTKITKSVRALTLDEIRQIFPHVNRVDQYKVEFDFSAESSKC